MRTRLAVSVTRAATLRSRRRIACQVAEEDGVRAGAGEGDAHPAGGLGDAGGDPQEPEADCRELGFGEGII